MRLAERIDTVYKVRLRETSIPDKGRFRLTIVLSSFNESSSELSTTSARVAAVAPKVFIRANVEMISKETSNVEKRWNITSFFILSSLCAQKFIFWKIAVAEIKLDLLEQGFLLVRVGCSFRHLRFLSNETENFPQNFLRFFSTVFSFLTSDCSTCSKSTITHRDYSIYFIDCDNIIWFSFKIRILKIEKSAMDPHPKLCACF